MTTIHHSIHPEDREVMVGMREQVAPMKGSITGPEARPLFDSMMLHVAAAPGVTYETATVGGVDGAWCRPADAADASAAILYFHGGAYVIGSAQAYRNFVGQVVARTKTAAFVPEYGLAPERPFPAAVDDARAAYAGLVAQGLTKIALAGDSAGGGLALVLFSLTVAQARHTGNSSPICAAAMSPWTDLALAGETMHSRAEADPLLTRDSLATTARLYLGEHSARDPLASPLHGDLADLPPVLIHVGEDEILLDDSRRYADLVHGQGGWCEVHVWEGMVHVFQSSFELLRAGKESLNAISEFLEHQLRGSAITPSAWTDHVDRGDSRVEPE